MAFITDVPLNQLRVLDRKTGSLLKYEDSDFVFLYYVNQGPVIFRTIIKKDKDDKFRLFIQQLPTSFDILKPLGADIEELKTSIQNISNRLNSMDEAIQRKLRLT